MGEEQKREDEEEKEKKIWGFEYFFQVSLSNEVSKAVRTETVLLWFMTPGSLVGVYYTVSQTAIICTTYDLV